MLITIAVALSIKPLSQGNIAEIHAALFLLQVLATPLNTRYTYSLIPNLKL